MENPDIQSEIIELRAIRRQVVYWRVGLVCLFLAIIFTCVSIFWSAIRNLANDGEGRDLFVQTLTYKLKNEVTPQVKEVGEETLRRLDFKGKIQYLNSRAPDVANASMTELRQLASDIPVRGQQVITNVFNQTIQARKNTLTKEFPDIKEEEITSFLADFTEETQTQVTNVTNSLFTPHINAMNGITNDLIAIQQVEGRAASADMPTVEMAVLIMDILRADMASMTDKYPGKKPGAAAPAAKQKPATPAKGATKSTGKGKK